MRHADLAPHPITSHPNHPMETVSVIIPTTCAPQRKELLKRAIKSVLEQQGVSIELIIAVNGKIFDPDYLQTLRADNRLKVTYLETPGAPLACKHGRSLVSSTYFGFLDDDDEYLPDALATKVKLISQDASLDMITTNGYAGRDNSLAYEHVEHINSDPLTALADHNWVASCGGLYRSASIDEQYFADLPPYIEWTMLAFRILLANKRVKFFNVPTFRINDTPDSLSKSDSYRTSTVYVIETLLKLPLPWHVRSRLRRRLLAARHELSVYNLQRGNRINAWKLHILSMAGLSGMKYASYTRRLFF